MKSVSVWVRPAGGACRVRVDGLNVDWLLKRLSQSFVFKTSEPVREDENTSDCTFHVAYTSGVPRGLLERLLGGIPEVRLMLDQA
ncbi:MAG: hypothetical protein HYX69_20540 [Planctomycetia bacterium]|nr:hypothetical protein [Planctomycetia bacterium]